MSDLAGGIQTIDIHSHFYPERYLRILEGLDGNSPVTCSWANPEGPVIMFWGGKTPPLHKSYYDFHSRVREMDAKGVDIHCLSLTQPMVHWAEPALALELSQAYNDSCAEAHESYPDRYLGLAMLPVLQPENALAELKRAANLPGMRGIYLSTHIENRELSDPLFFPIYEAIQELGWHIFLHPVRVVDPNRLTKFYLTNFIGNPTESAIAASHLIFGEVLDKFPKLSWILPHAGGTFPWLVGRITHGWGVRQECRHLTTAPRDYLRRFYYDTITHDYSALEYLIGLVGADRIVLGSDYCFDMSYQRPVDVVMDHSKLSETERAMILCDNAKSLLGL